MRKLTIFFVALMVGVIAGCGGGSSKKSTPAVGGTNTSAGGGNNGTTSGSGNSDYDKLVSQYIAAIDLTTQQKIAGQIETLLLEQTPVIYGYFYNYLTAQAKNVSGAYPTAIGHIFLTNATKS